MMDKEMDHIQQHSKIRHSSNFLRNSHKPQKKNTKTLEWHFEDMASMAMTASFLPTVSKLPLTVGGHIGGRKLAVVKAAAATGENTCLEFKTNEKSNQERAATMRRDVIFAAAAMAAAACSLATVATATAEEPPRGSEEARKKYAPICVTMPTAKICRK